VKKEEKEFLKDNEHIPTHEILQDIKDTEEEIRGYEILSKAEPNTRRINDMKIFKRRDFIKKIQRIIDLRKVKGGD
jgi:hypothetical protein